MKSIIIDTDPGIDDAAALAIALFNKELNVQLITTVAGNVSVDQVTDNALKLLDFWNQSIPVAKGNASPLMIPFNDASHVHGESGLGKYEFGSFSKSNLLSIHAVQAMYDKLIISDEPITIVAMGPLTNIALLVSMYPEVLPKIKEVVIMGGAIGRGNTGVYSEFNIATDPEAAKIVFSSELNMVLVPMEIGLGASLSVQDAQQLKQLNQTGDMLNELFQCYQDGDSESGFNMYDGCTIAYLLQPDLFEYTKAYVDVETQSYLTKGATVIDLEHILGQNPNLTVCTQIDTNRFKDWFMKSILNCTTKNEGS